MWFSRLFWGHCISLRSLFVVCYTFICDAKYFMAIAGAMSGLVFPTTERADSHAGIYSHGQMCQPEHGGNLFV